jgi:hypothetical protein
VISHHNPQEHAMQTYTATDLITAYAERGVTITAETAARYLAQRDRETSAYEAYLSVPAGTVYDWAATRPYGLQILCDCGKHLAVWATEQMVDEKPDRLVYCDACATRMQRIADRASEEITFVRLLTVEQVDSRREWEAAGIGAN